MKIFLLALAFLLIPVSSYGAFDNPGLSNQLLVETGGYDFTVTTLSTFDIDILNLSVTQIAAKLVFTATMANAAAKTYNDAPNSGRYVVPTTSNLYSPLPENFTIANASSAP